MSIQRKRSVEERSANRLVHGVVAPDVFTRNFQFAVHAENSSGMNSTGAREIALRVSQFFWKRKKGFNINADFFRGNRREILSDGVDACLSAKTATAGNCPEAPGGIQFQFHAVLKIDNYSVIAICRNLRDLVARPDDRL